MNDNLDELLERALAPTEPPNDLTARVMGRIARERTGRKTWTALAALAAGVVLSVSGYVGYSRLHSVEPASENAQRQLVFALQLTSEKIAAVDARLKRSSPQLQLPYRNLHEEK